MSNVSILFQEIMTNSSRDAKIKILEKERNNSEFTQVLSFILNPFVITGISTKRIEKFISVNAIRKHTHLLDIIDYISENHTGRDIDVAEVQYFIHSQKGQEEFFSLLLSKELKLGITAKTVNKVYGKGFIPSFDVMTAEKYNDYPEWVVGKQFAITNKIDGNRCIALKKNDDVTLWAGRSGQILEGFMDIENAIRKLPFDTIVFDGELTLQHTESLTSIEQYQKATSIIRKNGVKHGIKLTIFDSPSYEEFFITQKGVIPYSHRRKMLESALPSTKETDFLYVLPTLYEGSDVSQIAKWKGWAIETQNEGVMLNIMDAPYQFKRTKDILKVKVQEESDLEIVGFEVGKKSGKYADTLGGILVEYKGGTVTVGGGLSDALRDEIWNNQDKWIGRVIAVKHNGETVDTATGQVSIRFPRFKELREEGKEVNY